VVSPRRTHQPLAVRPALYSLTHNTARPCPNRCVEFDTPSPLPGTGRRAGWRAPCPRSTPSTRWPPRAAPRRRAGCRCALSPPTAACPHAITKPISCTPARCRPAPIPGTTC
jgi:hypothetical protein